MIKSFTEHDTKLLWETGKSRRVPASIRKAALRKLLTLYWARNLGDLATPGGNWLEALAGNRRGQHSILINDQYRLCFAWRDGDAYDVEIVDYH